MYKAALFEYFDRIEIIHLPERTDRLAALRSELARVGLDIDDPKVRIPNAPRPETTNGFPSRGVYGNFLSHLDIIRRAEADRLESVLILEDDAIFRTAIGSRGPEIAETIRTLDWDILFLGHSLRDPPSSENGFVTYTGGFYWAHCYAVRARVIPNLARYLESVIERPAGHPLGGKMYIDGSFTLFRQQNPDVKCLISSPRLSIQRGSESSLGKATCYGRLPFISTARLVRDELWRHGLISGGPS
ncbi:hypothetical protein [Bradyrhizobium sp. 170]|uniref:hypothetical protein n=1 Tax=Bradyrhizobium sp. 170 TaxID=2782641 RepID=UPI001FFF3ABA|nr:hypothetical protein [Bradyrhizobium sp. 170]UPK02380.1 LPS biosynthesis glycosyltransferase [Bradyrhizobium sp. 170]